MLLAADVGGTNVRIGLFDASQRRPVLIGKREYATAAFATFRDVAARFAREIAPDARVHAATIGVAGPVLGSRAELTNRAFVVDADDTVAAFGVRAHLLNDLVAQAYSVDALEPSELAVLQAGRPRADGHAALIAAGTGLGQALLPRVDGRLRPSPSEGGHADFAARTDRELALVAFLRARCGRAEVEQVLSGPGLVNLSAFTHGDRPCDVSTSPGDRAAQVSASALAGRCPACVEALDLFVSAYGAEAGNLALRAVATSGLYVGGGIAIRLLERLGRGDFLAAFLDKAPMRPLVEQVPVFVIRTPDAGLLGAAVHARDAAPAATSGPGTGRL